MGGIRARQRREEAAEHLGGRLAEDAWKQSGETLEAFKVGLEKFARKYKAKINKVRARCLCCSQRASAHPS